MPVVWGGFDRWSPPVYRWYPVAGTRQSWTCAWTHPSRKAYRLATFMM